MARLTPVRAAKVVHPTPLNRSGGEDLQLAAAVAADVGEDVDVGVAAGAGADAALQQVVLPPAEQPQALPGFGVTCS